MQALQRGGRLHVTGGNIIQYEDVAGGFLVAGSRFPGDGRLKQLHAGLDMLDQRSQLRNDRMVAVIAVTEWARNPAVCCRAA